MPENRGPAELVLTAAVARRYYVLGEAKTEIAGALGISRFKVARLLEAARADGLVRIEIVRQGAIDVDRSARLQEALGLRHALVVDCSSLDPVAVRGQLGRSAAELLEEILTEDDVLGLPWSRNVRATVDALRGLPPVDVVQLTGALAIVDEDSSAVDIVRRAARTGGGRPHLFFAPFILDDAASAAALRRQPPVGAALEQIPRVTVALFGVGAWAPGLSTIHDAVAATEQHAVARAGVVAETAGVLVDAEGREVPTALRDRLINLTWDQLRAIPEAIAIAAGRERAAAVEATVRGGLTRGVVCDADLADALLDRVGGGADVRASTV